LGKWGIKAADTGRRRLQGLAGLVQPPLAKAAMEGENPKILSLTHFAHGPPKFSPLGIRVLSYPGGLQLKPSRCTPLGNPFWA
jgi:hypothetical protein